jgi:hypothetical protein
MNPRMTGAQKFSFAAVAAVAAVALWLTAPAAAETVSVTLPELSPEAQAGGQAFIENCAQYHGMIGGGTDNGPPLIHKIYEPNHHGDLAFQRAVRQGSRAHHWRFGDMPPQPQVTDADVSVIVKFIREVQRANGID